MSQVKVELRNIVKEFPGRQGEDLVRAVNNVSMTIYDGEFFAMLGPSGCGKTTTLRLIAGFEQPTAGELLIDGKPMQGIPAYQRPVNTVFQDYALFPHMTVLNNVMFGLRMARVPKAEAERRAMEALELVRLPHVAKRKPREMSGGQQQRVALARALVNKPSVLLLDEPLGALDLKLRREMQLELKAMQREIGITFIFVTHDQEEAMTMADRIAVMEAGELLQVGTPEEIYETPVNRFVADFIGETNFIPGHLRAWDEGAGTGMVRLGDGTQVTGMLTPDEDPFEMDEEISLAIRPERISLQRRKRGAEDGADWTRLPATITEMNYLGTDTRYIVKLASGALVTVREQNATLVREREFSKGMDVDIVWENENAHILTW
ncbi:MAG TPA: ABC transporter ATP-binding protein [Aggregatilineales bacterium]|jgi:spermidine/putrescine transport system ATP-binding protein|nr:ABC transporter ATP-binding protein [Aggregatilineales bacterium]